MRCPSCGHEYEFTHNCPGSPVSLNAHPLEALVDVPRPKPPWTPWVSGINGLLFGPMAGGLVTFINLRRLGHPRKANLVLAGASGGSLVLIWVFIYLESYFVSGGQRFLEQVVGNVVSPWLFWYLQRKEFDDWDTRNPQTDADSGWKSAGWGVLGLVAYWAVAFALLVPTVFQEPR